MLTSSPMPYHNMLYKFFHSPQTKSLLTQKMQLHFLTNARFEPNTASNLAVQILTYTKGYASVLSSHLFLVFGSNLAFAPKNKNQMHFSVDLKRCCKLRVANLTRNTQQVTYDSQPVFWQATAIQVHEQKMD